MEFRSNTFHIGIDRLDQEQQDQLSAYFIDAAAQKNINIEPTPLLFLGEQNEQEKSMSKAGISLLAFRITNLNLERDVAKIGTLHPRDICERLEESLKEAISKVSNMHQVEIDGHHQLSILKSMGHDL